MSSLFFSYSHKDEELRDQLETHLAGLQRQGLISSWHDREITVGTDIGESIDGHLDAADIILLLVSPDFIASDYCYEREMQRALQRHNNHDARVIPVILRPCDWKDLPFGKLLAAPTDGKPVTKWPNRDEAFLDVVTKIKAALKELGKQPSPPHKAARPVGDVAAGLQAGDRVRSSNLRVRKRFTDLDKDRFRHEGFEYIANYFENSLEELVRRNPELERIFRRVDADNFTAAAYQDGEKVCTGSASASGNSMAGDGITYSMTDEPRGNMMNEALYIKSDDQSLFFEAMGMQSVGRDKEKLTFQGAAEYLWEIFIRPIQPRR